MWILFINCERIPSGRPSTSCWELLTCTWPVGTPRAQPVSPTHTPRCGASSPCAPPLQCGQALADSEHRQKAGPNLWANEKPQTWTSVSLLGRWKTSCYHSAWCVAGSREDTLAQEFWNKRAQAVCSRHNHRIAERASESPAGQTENVFLTKAVK